MRPAQLAADVAAAHDRLAATDDLVADAGLDDRTDRGRLCITAQYCAPWLRQQENYSLSVSKDRVNQCSEHVKRMLGYSIYPRFTGMVEGMHPKRILETSE